MREKSPDELAHDEFTQELCDLAEDFYERHHGRDIRGLELARIRLAATRLSTLVIWPDAGPSSRS